MNLTSIGNKYGTQKNSHKSFGQTILDIYEPYFDPLRNKQLNLLEIGVLSGASVFTWQEYFTNPETKIYGIEINPPGIETNRIKIFKCDQGDPIDLNWVMREQIKDRLDIIIDDGSHINEYTLTAFNFLWPYLKGGGYYIIEDTICTYDKAFIDWPGMVLNKPGTNFDNKRIDVDNFILSNLQKMDFDRSEIFFMHFYRNLLIIKKA